MTTSIDALIVEIGRDEPQKPRRWVHDGLRRELPAESQEAFEARVKRSAFSNLLQNEERLCLDAMIAKLNELGYDVGCKIYDGCLRPDSGPAQITVCENCSSAQVELVLSNGILILILTWIHCSRKSCVHVHACTLSNYLGTCTL